jgi:hypothetical protein
MHSVAQTELAAMRLATALVPSAFHRFEIM